jgi:hypothetical protein
VSVIDLCVFGKNGLDSLLLRVIISDRFVESTDKATVVVTGRRFSSVEGVTRNPRTVISCLGSDGWSILYSVLEGLKSPWCWRV